jgi:hypothetical protein
MAELHRELMRLALKASAERVERGEAGNVEHGTGPTTRYRMRLDALHKRIRQQERTLLAGPVWVVEAFDAADGENGEAVEEEQARRAQLWAIGDIRQWGPYIGEWFDGAHGEDYEGKNEDEGEFFRILRKSLHPTARKVVRAVHTREGLPLTDLALLMMEVGGDINKFYWEVRMGLWEGPLVWVERYVEIPV